MKTRASLAAELATLDEDLSHAGGAAEQLRAHVSELQGRHHRVVRALEESADPRLHEAAERLRAERADLDHRLMTIEEAMVANLGDDEVSLLIRD